MKYLLFFVILLAVTGGAATQDASAGIQAMIQETQKMKMEDGHLTLVWWIPDQYWEYSFRENSEISDEMAADFLAVVEGYHLFAVADGQIGSFGVDMTDYDQLAEHLTLNVGRTRLHPLDSEGLSSEMSGFLAIMKPIMAEMLGQFGEGLEFFAFKPDEGRPLLDPLSEGKFTVMVGDRRFFWRTPMGFLLPPKWDPETNEEFPGNYNFNPFTGVELVADETGPTEGPE